MNGYKIILKSIIVGLIIAVIVVPFFGIGFCAFRVSTMMEYSEEENREVMCEECYDSSPFASEILGCNRELLDEQQYYNEYRENN